MPLILIVETSVKNAMTKDIVLGKLDSNLSQIVGLAIHHVHKIMNVPPVEKADTVGQTGFVLKGFNFPTSSRSTLTKRASVV